MSDRLTKGREAEIRQQVERWRAVPFTSPTVEEWCRMANAAHDWPGDDPRSHEDREEISRELEDESLDGLGAMLCDALRLATKHRADLLAELDALRAAPPTTYQHADGTEEPIGELVARLTRERDEAIEQRGQLEAERDELNTLRENAVKSYCQALGRVDRAEARVRELEAERDVARRMGQAAARSAAEALGRSERAEADLAETRAQLARLRGAVAEPDRHHFGNGRCHCGPAGCALDRGRR